MNPIIVPEPVAKGNSLITNSVTHPIVNTHCIICGNAFQTGRVGKLYCSTRCKQFGYNHKSKISLIVDSKNLIISPTPSSFMLNEYVEYDKTQKKLKKFHELNKKQKKWEAIEAEINAKSKLDLPIGNYSMNSYVSDRLTESESFEYNELEQALDEKILDLDLLALSIEQWSFIKSMYPNMDKMAFFQLASSLSKDFIRQLSISEIGPDDKSMLSMIKNKYINHCCLIVEGYITFINNSSEESE